VTATRRLTKRKEAAVSYGAVPFHSIDRPPAAGRTGTAPSVSASGETEEGRKKKKKKVVGVSGTSQLVSSSSLMIHLPTPPT